MPPATITDRVLNRATLARQFLLERAHIAPLDAVHRLVGLQAQNPLDPYLALWSRLADFDPDAVGDLVERRVLVRIVVMRGTLHLVTGDDARALRPLVQPVLDAELARHSEFAPHLNGVDLEPVLDFAEPLLATSPMTGTRLRDALAARFPTLHAPALAYACRCLLPLVQVPPRGVWRKTGQVTSTPLDAWVVPARSDAITVDDMAMRYLAAFGPATAADAATWSRLTGFGEVFDRLRPRLATFRNERGQEVFDLPDAPRTDPDARAPVRFLPEYDNVLLSHADRSRFGIDRSQAFARAVGPFKGSVLVDGTVRAIWHGETNSNRKHTTLVVEHLRLGRREKASVAREAELVAGYWFEAATHDVRFVPVE